MNVPAPLVSMEPHAMMESISTHVYVLLALKGLTVRQTQMSVPVVLARTMERVEMVSLSTPVSVPMAMRATTVRQTQTSVPVIPVKMVANVQMAPTATIVRVHLDLKVSGYMYGLIYIYIYAERGKSIRKVEAGCTTHRYSCVIRVFPIQNIHIAHCIALVVWQQHILHTYFYGDSVGKCPLLTDEVSLCQFRRAL